MHSPSRSPGWLLVAVMLWTAAGALWFVSPWFPEQALREVQRATGGWLSITLLASTSLGVVALALLFGPGRQAFADVGWRRNALITGIAVTVTLWLVMQLAAVADALATGRPVMLAPSGSQGAGVVLGPLLAQVLGTALIEETVMRGWLWPQLWLHWRSRLGNQRALWVALLASQVLFALLHVPMLLYRGAAPGELVGPLMMLFMVGIVFAAVYAATGNLFIAVGAHALGNAPTMVVAPGSTSPTLAMLAALLLLVAVRWFYRRPGQAFWHAVPAGSSPALR